jgi:hypothetical protein
MNHGIKKYLKFNFCKRTEVKTKQAPKFRGFFFLFGSVCYTSVVQLLFFSIAIDGKFHKRILFCGLFLNKNDYFGGKCIKKK